ncbi:hypothetical protein GOP47_0019490 [Adiantum capillus-veneris]|uniref:Uncharacterized protein n=1 Tax=Adiantum capillus-veneris TaxID=13818 RepID=A0A9D4Z8I6_ADICA|nr:hypothetical protein GOP47_0019490 [Adiantum capillus-veneris]
MQLQLPVASFILKLVYGVLGFQQQPIYSLAGLPEAESVLKIEELKSTSRGEPDSSVSKPFCCCDFAMAVLGAGLPGASGPGFVQLVVVVLQMGRYRDGAVCALRLPPIIHWNWWRFAATALRMGRFCQSHDEAGAEKWVRGKPCRALHGSCKFQMAK